MRRTVVRCPQQATTGKISQAGDNAPDTASVKFSVISRGSAAPLHSVGLLSSPDWILRFVSSAAACRALRHGQDQEAATSSRTVATIFHGNVVFSPRISRLVFHFAIPELNESIGSKILHHLVQRLLVPSVRQQVTKPQVLMRSQQNCSKQEERRYWTECTEYVWRSGKLARGRSPCSSHFSRKAIINSVQITEQLLLSPMQARSFFG